MSEIAKKESPYCPVCGKKGIILYMNVKDRLFGVLGEWNYFKCSECSISWINPKPLETEIPKLYKTYYTHHQPLKFINFSDLTLRKKIKLAILRKYYGYKLPDFKDKWVNKLFLFVCTLNPFWVIRAKDSIGGLKFIKNGKILDVGFGSGDFLMEMKYLGWDAYGIEPDEQAVEIGLTNNLLVKKGQLEDGLYSESYFDAIHMDNVIEHLPEPGRALAACHKLLKSGGRVIIKTCSNNSLAHRIYKSDYRGLETPRHFQIFSPKALKLLAEKEGFKVKLVKTSFNGYIWASSSKIHKGLPSPELAVCNSFLRLFLGAISFIMRLMFPLSGDDILIILIKN